MCSHSWKQLAACLPLLLGLGACQPPSTTAPATPVPQPAANQAASGLTVEEYAVVSAQEDRPDHLEFNQRLPQGALAKRGQWRGFSWEPHAAAVNQALGRFGYRLAIRTASDGGLTLYDLCRGDKVVLPNLITIGPLNVSDSGRSIALLVEDRNGHDYLVRQDAVTPWGEGEHAFIRPVLLGDELLTVEAGTEANRYSLRHGQDTVYTFTTPPATVANPIKGLWAWAGHWALEVDGQVWVDGQSLSKQMGYDEVFGYQLVAGQPFYFFKEDGRIGVSYAGEVLPQQYDDVVHYRCCEPAAFNVEGNGTMVWYYALRGGIWHYVEAGKYE